MRGQMAENLYKISNKIKFCALSWPIRWWIACKYYDITTSGLVSKVKLFKFNKLQPWNIRLRRDLDININPPLSFINWYYFSTYLSTFLNFHTHQYLAHSCQDLIPTYGYFWILGYSAAKSCSLSWQLYWLAQVTSSSSCPMSKSPPPGLGRIVLTQCAGQGDVTHDQPVHRDP